MLESFEAEVNEDDLGPYMGLWDPCCECCCCRCVGLLPAAPAGEYERCGCGDECDGL